MAIVSAAGGMAAGVAGAAIAAASASGVDWGDSNLSNIV